MTSRLRHALHLRSVRVLAVAVALGVAAFNTERLPALSLLPVVMGLLPWIVGKYVGVTGVISDDLDRAAIRR